MVGQKRLALVTGASCRIGEETVLQLNRAGFKVISHSRRHQPSWSSRQVSGDLANHVVVDQIADNILNTHGQMPDVLVCIAGGSDTQQNDYPLGGSIAEFYDVFNKNFMTAYHCCRRFAPAMQKKKWGRIVTLGTCMLGLPKPDARLASYTAAKGALHEWTLALAVQLRPYGVTVNCVAPSWTRDQDDMTEDNTRAATPTEIASVINFAVSEDAGFLSGELIRVHGANIRGQGYLPSEKA